MQEYDLLILGAGWTCTFLIPLLDAKTLSFAATTRDGRKVAGAHTIKWSFDPSEDSAPNGQNQFSALPLAKNILITFPLNSSAQTKTLVKGYQRAHSHNRTGTDIHFIQLGSTGIWQVPTTALWTTRHSPYNTSYERVQAEDELLKLGGCVLNLAGLWGGERQPRNWLGRVAKTKEDVKYKNSLHMIHGLDVARAIVAVTQKWDAARGQRWMLTDGFVYDWWSLLAGWADAGQDDGKADRKPKEQAEWVRELMQEEGVRALPRPFDMLGRCYDSREFWEVFGLTPIKARI